MKKLLVLICSLVLVLVGCGSDDSGASNVEQLEGDEIIFSSGWDATANNDSDFANYIREYTGDNYKLEVGSLDGVDKLMLDLASEVPMNLVNVSNEDYADIMANGIALDLKPYLEEYGQNILDKFSDEAWELVTGENGEIWGLPTYSSREEVTISVFYRKDILEKEGLSVPTTTDEVADTVCTLAKRGYKYPWGVNWGSAQYEYELKQAYGVGYWWNEDENGDLKYIADDPRYLDYLKYAKQMYDCGGYGDDYETITQEDRDTRFINGDTVFLTNPYYFADEQATGFEAIDKKWSDVVGLQSLIIGPDGHKSTETYQGKATRYTIIPKYMEPYAKQTIEFVNKLYEDEFIINAYYGVEGETFEYDEDGIPYLIVPENELPLGDGIYYKIGGYDKLDKKSFQAQLNSYRERYEAGEELSPATIAFLEAHTDEAIAAETQDPMGAALTLTKWPEQRACLADKITLFSDLYITGAKTDEDYAALKDDINNTCAFEEVYQEVNDWYKS